MNDREKQVHLLKFTKDDSPSELRNLISGELQAVTFHDNSPFTEQKKLNSFGESNWLCRVACGKQRKTFDSRCRLQQPVCGVEVYSEHDQTIPVSLD